jgi:hypothetical protein
MKQSELIELIENPQKASVSDLQKIESLKNEFPFFQSAHILLTYLSKKYDSSLFQQTLRNTAITIPNRTRLYNLLHEQEVEEIVVDLGEAQVEKKPEVVKVVEAAEIETKPEISEEKVAEVEEPVTANTEIEHLKAIELLTESPEKKEEELNEQIEKEISKQIVSSFIEKKVLKTPELHKPEKKKLDGGSFSDWLKALKSMDRPEETETEEKQEEVKKPVQPKPKPVQKKEEQKSIIDKIIESNPGNIRLNPAQKFFAPDNKAKESLFENEDLVTETLARIYALQGNTSKAIRAYEILSLRFPQKSAYFASLIENLKKGNQ